MHMNRLSDYSNNKEHLPHVKTEKQKKRSGAMFLMRLPALAFANRTKSHTKLHQEEQIPDGVKTFTSDI